MMRAIRDKLTRVVFAGVSGAFVLLATAAPSFSDHPMRVEQVERRVDVLQGKVHETLRVTFVEGDRKRIDTLDRLKEIGGAPLEEVRRIEIIRLDKGLVWRFNKTEGTHSEQSFEALKGLVRKADGVSWTAKSVDDLPLRKTGDRKEINGHEADRYELDVLLGEGDGSEGLRLVGEVWSASDVPDLHELRSFHERLAEIGLSGLLESDPVIGGAPLKKAEAALNQIRRWLMRSNRYPILVEADVYRAHEKAAAGKGERLASIRQETKGIYPAIVFCTCTDREKLFEFWGGFISLQLPLFQQPF